jgi:hypothetical protein
MGSGHGCEWRAFTREAVKARPLPRLASRKLDPLSLLFLFPYPLPLLFSPRLLSYTMSLLSSLLPILWTILHSFLYGFHISSLNGVQDAVLCPDAKDVPTRWGLKECVDFTVHSNI